MAAADYNEFEPPRMRRLKVVGFGRSGTWARRLASAARSGGLIHRWPDPALKAAMM